ncbi:MAG: hypothetical protein GY757_29840, partial [bacterium]|nr:hypothetical protein [bacterium]
AFGYFQSDEENENVLQGIYNSLKPDGTYWFDCLNAQQVEKDMVPRSVSNPAPGVEVTETRKIENGRIIKDIVFKRETRKQERDIDPDYSHHSFNSDNTTSTIKTCNSYDSTNTHYRESVRLFTREQLQDMFKRRGFRIIEEYGDFHGNPWTTLSPRTILVGRREQ